MLTNGTKRRIDTARDILVGKLPDPKSQVEQITIALIYKFMDDMDKQSEELGGKVKFFTGEYAKYAWSKIFDPRVSGHELVGLYGEAIQRMNHNPNIPQLFRNIFKNAYLPYRDPETLKSFLKAIGEFEYDHSEKLGDAFEYLLSVMGSQGDAGQFRTPRHIIDFIVKVVEPEKNETILDPACGTAGFLISSYKHILEKNKKDGRVHLTPVQKKRLIENFAGYDISPDMVRLSLVNMYLHGFKSPEIYEYDTLTSEEKWQEVFDVILANPPFMSPKGGIRPHKRFSVQAKRSEVLFVDYIAEHLNPNGRAGIIVPEGIIFQSGTAYKKLRKMLVDHSLYAVVSLPSGVFNPYAGVKTSVLMLDKNLTKKTNKILFVKINNDGFGLGAQRREIKGSELPLALEIITKYKQSVIGNKEFEFNADEGKIASLVEKIKIAESGDYNLSGDRYKEAIVYSGKWDFVELGEVAEYINGFAFKPSDWKKSGRKIIRIQNLTGTSKEFNFTDRKDIPAKYLVKKGNLLISWSATIGFYLWEDDDAYLNQHIFKVNLSGRILRNYFYYLGNKITELIKGNVHGNTMTHITKCRFDRLRIPLPPLEVQEQIVAELDSYQKIIDGARQVVENYKPTFKIDPDWKMVELGDVSLKKGEYGSGASKRTFDEKVRYVRITDINEDGTLSKRKLVSPSIIEKKYFLKKDDILFARSGSVGLTYYHDLNDKLNYQYAGYLIRFVVDKTKAVPYYVYLVTKSDIYTSWIKLIKKTGTISNINAKEYSSFKIPLPPIGIQQQIIARIEKEQKAVDATKDLINLFEQKIKDKISNVWGKE